MRIHTNIFGTAEIRAALEAEKDAGRIAPHVTFKTLAPHRSQSHAYAYEIQLEAALRDNGRRAGNSGSYGAMQPEYDGYAATYDEWGWLLAALYEVDPAMIVGTAKYPVYRDAVHFHRQTALTYNPAELISILEDEGEDPFPIVTGQAARTKRGYLIGRRGANRTDSQPSYWPGRIQPRTVAEVREFARLSEAVTA